MFNNKYSNYICYIYYLYNIYDYKKKQIKWQWNKKM